MNIIDIILAVILLYGLIRGFFRGFFAELASLVAFVAGIYVAVYFSHILSDYLIDKVSWSIQFVKLIAFVITFVLIVFVISLAGKFLTGIMNFAALGIINKLAGAGFGLIKLAFIISVVIMFFGETNEDINIVEEETIEDSLLFPHVKAIAPVLLPAILREAKEIDLLEEDFEV
ncbi:CvpA family protein [Gillisia sp. Q332]|uniref:CvpA family protein n=1 Tax=Gillisia xinjiangensis TaxID=3384765 RepID=UPI00391CCE44